MEYVIKKKNDDYLMHYGIKGQKWGVRRFQKKDGSLTSQGKKRYNEDEGPETKKKGLSDKQKKAIKVGAAVAGTAVAAYGAYKIHEVVRDKNFNIRMNEAKKYCDDYTKSGIFDRYVGESTSDSLSKMKRESSFYEHTFDRYANQAKKDSFGKALKNVASDEYGKLSSKVKNSMDNKRQVKIAAAKTKEAAKTAKIKAQKDYIDKMINNTQSHVDPASGLYKSDRWNHAYTQTLKSRQGRIRGDKMLYGEKAVAGRDAGKETRYYMHEALKNGSFNEFMNMKTSEINRLWNL